MNPRMWNFNDPLWVIAAVIVAWVLVTMTSGCSVGLRSQGGTEVKWALFDKLEGKDAQHTRIKVAGLAIGSVVLGRIETETSRIPGASDANSRSTQILNAQGQAIRTEVQTMLGQFEVHP